uniref:Ubiquitin-conjugating enzyme E2 Z n=1 Tax=viral metagenome TaxID=1070528 RepID=A0A6C0DCP5_9ZZZZ
MADEMASLGIYYKPDEANILKGTALIIGPDNTPYEGCPLLFSVEMTREYPFKCPSVTFITSDGRTRFHPNLYVTGKVCLSILGTYPGPSWTSAMNLQSIFMSILSLLTANPITNEPSWENHPYEGKAQMYAEWVQHRIICKTISDLVHGRDSFEEISNNTWKSRQIPKIMAIIDRNLGEEKTYTNIPYQMTGTTSWNEIKGALTKCLE